jgi:hypothetical protein
MEPDNAAMKRVTTVVATLRLLNFIRYSWV